MRAAKGARQKLPTEERRLQCKENLCDIWRRLKVDVSPTRSLIRVGQGSSAYSLPGGGIDRAGERSSFPEPAKKEGNLDAKRETTALS
jgi:hypothetical protein